MARVIWTQPDDDTNVPEMQLTEDEDEDEEEQEEDGNTSSGSIDIDHEYEKDERMDTDAKTSVQPTRFETLKTIERKTKKHVVLKTAETEDVFARCHAQDQSPVFTTLPREIRELIWKFATSPYEDEAKAYKEKKYYCRPGHTAPLVTDYALLLTCRRAWLEAHASPMLQAEQCYWFRRRAPDARKARWMRGLTTSNRRNLGHLHIFAQMCYIEGLAHHDVLPLQKQYPTLYVRIGEFQPRMMQVTIRHTDWWYWESEAPLRFEDSWLKTLLDTEELRGTHTLKLELETLDYKVDQLMPIVERLSRLKSNVLKTHLVDGKPTKTTFILNREPEVYKWSGPANIDGKTLSPYENKDTLNYHVITLTWRLYFPEHPHAHVPTLRRAPRIGLHDDEDGTLYPVLRERTRIARPEEQIDGPMLRMPQGLSPWERFRHRRNRRIAPSINLDLYGLIVATRMEHALDNVQGVEMYSADMHEWFRRAVFDLEMARVHQEKWKQKWKAEGSLLRLED